MTETERKALPPYLPYRTFTNFLDHLRAVGIPSHIDKGAMASMSGAIQSYIKLSLRYMKLINADDVPQDFLKKLVMAQGDERKVLLKELFGTVYAFLDIDLGNTTQPKLREAIAALGAQGETVDKVVAFLVAMAKDAGVPLSNYLTKRAHGPRRQRTPRGTGDPLRRDPPPPASNANGEVAKKMGDAMKTIALPGANGQLTLSGTFNVFDLVGAERDLVFAIIDKMKAFQQEHGKGDEP